MDTKNVIAAISLSAAVLILYSLFFVEPIDPSTIKKDAVQEVLPLAIARNEDYYDPIYSPILEKKLDENCWWQLSTMDYLIHHMGNQIPDFEAELPWVNKFDFNSYNNIELFKQKSKKIAIQSTFIRKIIKKVHTWSYQKLYG